MYWWCAPVKAYNMRVCVLSACGVCAHQTLYSGRHRSRDVSFYVLSPPYSTDGFKEAHERTVRITQFYPYAFSQFLSVLTMASSSPAVTIRNTSPTTLADLILTVCWMEYAAYHPVSCCRHTRCGRTLCDICVLVIGLARSKHLGTGFCTIMVDRQACTQTRMRCRVLDARAHGW